ncbi:MAG: tetraacyldisaccharide 4'-kinase, partial [Pseudomonadota bacterium]|nr:tetraacyldisaccharide 4'-kinase [Pseudomonadota bacterium]
SGPTVVAVDRPAGAKLLVSLGADVVIMDDGFQNPSLIKDLSLVVVDGKSGFGNGRLIPAGPLRESVKNGLDRADAIVLKGEAGDDVMDTLQASGKPVLRARTVPLPSIPMHSRRVLAFAGTGRPTRFFDTCTALGANIVETRPYPDHYPYTTQDLVTLADRAKALRALLVTTAKDAARLPRSFCRNICIVEQTVEWAAPQDLDTLLASVFAP